MKILPTLLSAAVMTVSLSAFSQKTDSYEKIYYTNPEIPITEVVEVKTKNIVAQEDVCKMALSIKNLTSDFLMFVPQESKFIYPEGEKKPVSREYFIEPNKAKTKTLEVNGGNEFLQESFSVELGNLFQIPIDGKSQKTPNFQLPASNNSFTVGDFKVKLLKYNASTKEAKATFEVTYTGNDMAIINPANLSVIATRKKSEETVTYANDNKKAKPVLLRSGNSTKIVAVFHIPGKIVDMQFATMNILWNNTFVETKPVLLPKVSFDVKMDIGLTEGKK
ncbi:MAG: hypothetical protein COA33_005440 [Fluviicola sp.]|nr:hypothetical protein [Fluviicola sp.]